MGYPDNLKSARDGRGLSLADAFAEVKNRFPETKPSIGRIRSLEKGTRFPDIGLVTALCTIYEVDFDETCPELVAQRDRIAVLLGGPTRPQYAARDSNPEPTVSGLDRTSAEAA